MSIAASDRSMKGGLAGPGLVMFDWDGVLADSLDIFTSVFLDACRRCHFHGLEAPGRLMELFDGNMYAAMEALGLERRKIGQILEYFRGDTLARIHEIMLFDGISEALDRIAREKIVVIITSNLTAIPTNVLSREGVRCVSQILGVEADTSKVRKIRKTMLQYPALPAFYVGDTKGDMTEGREAGAGTIAATWGWHSEEKLNQERPDYRVRSPGELSMLFCG